MYPKSCGQKNVNFAGLNFLEISSGNFSPFGQLLLRNAFAHPLPADVRAKNLDSRPIFFAERHDILHREKRKIMNDMVHREKISIFIAEKARSVRKRSFLGEIRCKNSAMPEIRRSIRKMKNPYVAIDNSKGDLSFSRKTTEPTPHPVKMRLRSLTNPKGPGVARVPRPCTGTAVSTGPQPGADFYGRKFMKNEYLCRRRGNLERVMAKIRRILLQKLSVRMKKQRAESNSVKESAPPQGI